MTEDADVYPYVAANAVLDMHLAGLLRNEAVIPHWVGDSGAFWYRRESDTGGTEFMMVTPDGVRVPVSDQTPDTNSQPAPGMLVSPDGKWGLFTHDDNLIVRELKTGGDRKLTSDGEPYYSWGKLPDDSLTVVTRKKEGRSVLPFQTFWSPDSRFLIAPRLDERELGVQPFVEWVPADGSRRPVVHEVRWDFTGDREQVRTDYFLFEPLSGRSVRIALPGELKPGLFDDFVVGWSVRGRQAFLLTRTAGSRSARILRLDLESGALAAVVEEESDTRVATNTVEYHGGNIRVLGDGAEIVWFSDRSGFGHLYLYDAQSGRLKNAITRGDWLVFDIVAVDESRRRIFFTAGGREPGRDPYFRHLYSASLDGTEEVRLLTEPDADHHFEPPWCSTIARLWGAKPPQSLVNTQAQVFIDTWSRVDQAPVSVLRSTIDGRVLTELERADPSRLFAAGWRPPVRQRVKAADGVTDLYAVFYAPSGVTEGASFPVIDAAYGGPQVVVTPRNFIEAYRSEIPSGRSALAKLGFGVVTVDGRGTPMRSREFRNAGYTEFTQVGIDDHIAAIRNMAAEHAGMDLNRVGILGWSWGGTFAAQAILSRPQFYKVAISGAGVYDYAAMYTGQFDNMIGPPVFADSTAARSATAEAPVNWEKLDITRMAAKLQGRLLIAFADLDENVPAHQAMRLVEALTRAGKPYDLLYLPNRTHAGKADGYYIKRIWDYFLDHLRNPEPIRDFMVAPPAG
jgi:dipeptidyl-peptidase-4